LAKTIVDSRESAEAKDNFYQLCYVVKLYNQRAEEC
jgi:hypothetical protein